MKAYLLGVMGTVLLSSILTAVISEGKTSGLIKGITRLVCVLAIVSPIPTYLQNEKNDKNSDISQLFFGETVIQTDSDFIKYYSEMRVLETESMLETELKEKFAVDVNVTLEWELIDADIKIGRIITGSNASEEVKREMYVYLTENYCSEVRIE